MWFGFSPILILVAFMDAEPLSLAVWDPAKDFLRTKDCLDLVEMRESETERQRE